MLTFSQHIVIYAVSQTKSSATAEIARDVDVGAYGLCL